MSWSLAGGMAGCTIVAALLGAALPGRVALAATGDRRERLDRQRRILAAAYVALVAVAVLQPLAIAGRLPAVRPAAGLLVALLVPGAAIIGFFSIDDLLSRAVLSIAASVTTVGLSSLAMVYGHRWSPTALLVSLAVPSAWALSRHAAATWGPPAPPTTEPPER